MAFNVEEWRATMRRNHGPDWRDVLIEGARRGGKAKVSKGFGRMSPEQHKLASAAGGRKSKRGRDNA